MSKENLSYDWSAPGHAVNTEPLFKEKTITRPHISDSNSIDSFDADLDSMLGGRLSAANNFLKESVSVSMENLSLTPAVYSPGIIGDRAKKSESRYQSVFNQRPMGKHLKPSKEELRLRQITNQYLSGTRGDASSKQTSFDDSPDVSDVVAEFIANYQPGTSTLSRVPSIPPIGDYNSWILEATSIANGGESTTYIDTYNANKNHNVLSAVTPSDAKRTYENDSHPLPSDARARTLPPSPNSAGIPAAFQQSNTPLARTCEGQIINGSNSDNSDHTSGEWVRTAREGAQSTQRDDSLEPNQYAQLPMPAHNQFLSQEVMVRAESAPPGFQFAGMTSPMHPYFNMSQNQFAAHYSPSGPLSPMPEHAFYGAGQLNVLSMNGLPQIMPSHMLQNMSPNLSMMQPNMMLPVMVQNMPQQFPQQMLQNNNQHAQRHFNPFDPPNLPTSTPLVTSPVSLFNQEHQDRAEVSTFNVNAPEFNIYGPGNRPAPNNDPTRTTYFGRHNRNGHGTHNEPRSRADWSQMVQRIIYNSDQQASIILQQKIKQSSAEDKVNICDAILKETIALSTDRFGNFLVQRCMEQGTSEQLDEIAGILLGNVETLSQDIFGCHVMQKALDTVTEHYKELFIRELLENALGTIYHKYGCHVWQKLFELRWEGQPPNIMTEVNRQVAGHWTIVALGETGSLVVQNIFENCLEQEKRPCLDEVLENISVIARGQFGNWCIQHIVEHGTEQDQNRALEHILDQCAAYSTDQFGSKVIEKCLKVAPGNFLGAYLDRITVKPDGRPRSALIDIAGDQYGNYLIQWVLQNCSPYHYSLISQQVRQHMVSLRGSKYGSRVAVMCNNPNFGRPVSTRAAPVGNPNFCRGGPAYS